MRLTLSYGKKKEEVTLMFIENEKALMPVNTRAFSVSQQSSKRLNKVYAGVIVITRFGPAQVIAQIEVIGLYRYSVLNKLLSLLFGTRFIETYFRKRELSPDELERLVVSCLFDDATRVDPYLRLSQSLDATLAQVRAASTTESLFDALYLPEPEDCLDGL